MFSIEMLRGTHHFPTKLDYFSQWHQPCSLTMCFFGAPISPESWGGIAKRPRDDLGPTCRAIFGSANVFVGTVAMQTVAVMQGGMEVESGVRSMVLTRQIPAFQTGAPSPLHENDCQAKFLGRKFRRRA